MASMRSDTDGFYAFRYSFHNGINADLTNDSMPKHTWFNKYVVSILIGASWSFAAVYTGKVEKTFSQPFFLTYIHAISTFLLCALTYVLLKVSGAETLLVRKYESFGSRNEILKLFAFVVLDFSANFLFIWSLSLTAASSASTLEQCTSLFIAMLSFCFLGERFSCAKVLGLLVAVGGAVTVIGADSDDFILHTGTKDMLGDVIVLCGVCPAAAIYMVLFKYWYGVMAFGDMLRFFIWKNVIFMLLFSPGFYFADELGLETFRWPSSRNWIFIGLIGLLSFVFNMSLNWSIISISPLHARLSILIGLPITFVLDTVFGVSFNWVRLFGIVLVMLGLALHFLSERGAMEQHAGHLGFDIDEFDEDADELHEQYKQNYDSYLDER